MTTAETTEAVVDESQAAVETAVETQQTDETQLMQMNSRQRKQVQVLIIHQQMAW